MSFAPQCITIRSVPASSGISSVNTARDRHVDPATPILIELGTTVPEQDGPLPQYFGSSQ